MDVGGANSVVVTVCFLVGLVWLLLREITVHFDQWVSKGVAMVTGSWVLGGRLQWIWVSGLQGWSYEFVGRIEEGTIGGVGSG